MTNLLEYDAVILGAGGAGLFCAATAARRGKKVIALDHGEKLGKKILISGGGRCNFTNLNASAKTYFSENEHFAKSALARFTPDDFIALVRKYHIPFHEKKLGQLFCDQSAQQIVDLLAAECREAGAKIQLNCRVIAVEKKEDHFLVETSLETYKAKAVVVATGGPSIPKIGATDFGQRLAKEFGLAVTALDPALVSLTMDHEFQNKFSTLSGMSVDSEVKVRREVFRENILFTHTGLSGPAILQASLYWYPKDEIEINLSPAINLEEFLLNKKRSGERTVLKNSLSEIFTKRIAELFVDQFFGEDGPIRDLSDMRLRNFAHQLHHWRLSPVETGGFGKAEVTRGGVKTSELSQKTMESKKVPGLYFIGEVVDVTGRLGGFNFQWAWASGFVAGEAI